MYSSNGQGGCYENQNSRERKSRKVYPLYLRLSPWHFLYMGDTVMAVTIPEVWYTAEYSHDDSAWFVNRYYHDEVKMVRRVTIGEGYTEREALRLVNLLEKGGR